MPWKCPVCGYENDDDALYCIKCGTQKPSVTTQQPSQSAPTDVQQTTVPQAPPTPVAPPQPTQAPPSPTVAQTASPSNPPAPVPTQQVVTQPPVPQPPAPTIPPAPPTPTSGKYYILFINTPYASLINQRVPLSFDIFPTISVGRSPENVIIVPDPEISRRHAIISLENGQLYIEDLNSTNGTYVYDGKIFQPVKGKQKIEPNSIIKLGNQTMIKIIKE
ncbi:FHA domain-containing protein [Stygiolobus azoricus]|uniref:FHA domain-containing protein n=1 Tax=Stygiolobus azoricus TaxID=41675 RepID=A0A650CNT0_9CREN|nr:FHA domain-containing protein [Stygiolobus azoricus]QGR19157.1 FHA domain-containing protein [Stygiolobus azoricus]